MNHSYQTWGRQKREKGSRIRALCRLPVSPEHHPRGEGARRWVDFEHSGVGLGLEVPSWPPSGHKATSVHSHATSTVTRVPRAGGGLSLPERNRLGQEGREDRVEQKADFPAGPDGDMPCAVL